MAPSPLRVAAISLHTSPIEAPGSADAGGMNVVVLESARALARRGHRVDMLTRRTDPGTDAVVEVEPGLRVVHLDAGPAAPLAKSAMEQAIGPFTASLRAYVRESGNYDVLHAHHWFSGIAALDADPEHRIPLLQSFHSVAAPPGATSLAAGEPAESSGRVAGERRAARGADRVIAVSDAEAATVRARYGVPAERLSVVRPGVDVDVFRPPEDGRRAVPPRLLFAARLQPLKAPDLAIEVLARLDRGDGVRLVLAGGASADHADYVDRLRELATARGVADRVDLLGSVNRSELARLMREASALLVPSWSETFGLVALEAQASGSPVVAWRGAGGIAEAVGEGGMVLDDRDPALWARAVRTLLDDAAGRQRRSAAARDFAEQRTWDTTAAGLESVYRRTREERS